MEFYLALRKEGNPVTGYNMEETCRCYAKQISQPQKKQMLYDSTYEVSKVVKFTEI